MAVVEDFRRQLLPQRDAVGLVCMGMGAAAVVVAHLVGLVKGQRVAATVGLVQQGQTLRRTAAVVVVAAVAQITAAMAALVFVVFTGGSDSWTTH